MSIRVYKYGTTSLELVCELDNYRELVYNRQWYGIGAFTIVISTEVEYSKELLGGRVVMVDNDPKKIGIICEVVTELDSSGIAFKTVRGRELKWLTNRRVITPPAGSSYYVENTTVSTAMSNLIESQMGSNAIASRKDGYYTSVVPSAIGGQYVLTARGDRLDETLCTMAEESGLGWGLELNSSNKYQLWVSLGTDLTAEIRLNPSLDTLDSASLIQSDVDYKNYCYADNAATVQGRYSGASEPTGVNRYEIWEDATDVETTTEVIQKADQVLASHVFERTISGSAAQSPSYRFDSDYFLGDIVSVEVFGVIAEAQIVAAQESWAFGRYDVALTFDKPYQEFPLATRRKIDRLSKTLRRLSISGATANLMTTNGDIIVTTDGNYVVLEV